MNIEVIVVFHFALFLFIIYRYVSKLNLKTAQFQFEKLTGNKIYKNILIGFRLCSSELSIVYAFIMIMFCSRLLSIPNTYFGFQCILVTHELIRVAFEVLLDFMLHVL